MLFRFDVEFITKCQSQIGYRGQMELQSEHKFVHRMENMWKNGLFTDITIECPAHVYGGNCTFCEDYNEMKFNQNDLELQQHGLDGFGAFMADGMETNYR